jgi:hypothetical protein
METVNKKELVKLLSYIVMGDGGLYFPPNRTEGTNAFFAMNMKRDNEDYILFCKNVLEQITGCRVSERKDYNVDGCDRKPQLRLESKRHPLLTTLHGRIYTEKYKGIDPHALKMLDAEALAILYMCDGSFVTTKPDPKRGLVNGSYNVTLNMKRLSYGDLFILKKALKEKLDLEFNINRQNQYYYLRLRMKDFYKFMEMVAPHVLPSFQYKIHESFRTVSP